MLMGGRLMVESAVPKLTIQHKTEDFGKVNKCKDPLCKRYSALRTFWRLNSCSYYVLPK